MISLVLHSTSIARRKNMQDRPSESFVRHSKISRRVLLRKAAAALEAAGVEVPRRVAGWLLADALGCRRVALHAYPERLVEAAARRRFDERVARVAAGEPLQYVLGHADFYSLRLAVTPAVLIPRPETEQVVEAALRRVRAVDAPCVLDAGTGSGCIALAIKHECPDAEVWACDVSTEALAVARANARAYDLKVHFLPVDLLAGAEAREVLPGKLDLLVSNPPYIPGEEMSSLPPVVRDHEPPEALFCGDDPLRFYRALAAHAHHLLVPGGALVVEAHAPQAAAVQGLFDQFDFTDVQVARDLADHPRIVTGRRKQSLSPAKRTQGASA